MLLPFFPCFGFDSGIVWHVGSVYCNSLLFIHHDHYTITVLVLIKLTKMRMHCGCVAVPVNWYFDIISIFFAKFMNVVHCLKLGETPSNSASKPGSKLSATFLNIVNYLKTLRCGYGAVAFIFSIYLKPVLYNY